MKIACAVSESPRKLGGDNMRVFVVWEGEDDVYKKIKRNYTNEFPQREGGGKSESWGERGQRPKKVKL
jgi:hypothetical protein